MRIIPARAGFTVFHDESDSGTEDHPRSRGVYWLPQIHTDSEAGSSPLARGLRVPWARIRLRHGIIPARAGFTVRVACITLRGADHPRSRGVYGSSTSRPRLTRGSSPLARGLLPALRSESLGDRIIPARAGFTGGEPVPGVDGWDHPRSRGVYPSVAEDFGGRVGSSPLARGLPLGSPWGLVGGRIIPARAGFTWSCLGKSCCGPDHPRSRGVYSSTSTRICAPGGSSPLARGLPRCPGRGRAG